jgi:glycosyltransferase involved in cell wall biosynthesis
MLSIVIPSYKDPLLHKTIQSLLDNATGDIEIIPVIDGYTLKEPLSNDPRVHPVFLHKNGGMRNAINKGVSLARGEYLMRTDEHCIFAKGYDTVLTTNIKDNWIVVPRRYFLDVDKWEVMDISPVDYEKLLIIENPRKFSAVKWKNRTKTRVNKMIDETMAFQGSCWVMSKKLWDTTIKDLDSEGYGILYQDSVEMSMKVWQSGGKIMLNKNTWYAHKHRSFSRTHSYDGSLSKASFEYALKTWGDYYKKELCPRFGIV